MVEIGEEAIWTLRSTSMVMWTAVMLALLPEAVRSFTVRGRRHDFLWMLFVGGAANRTWFNWNALGRPLMVPSDPVALANAMATHTFSIMLAIGAMAAYRWYRDDA